MIFIDKIIVVVGATASGKSDLSLHLAKNLNGEIISCDSIQVYKDLNVISAKVSKLEMQNIEHHLIDILEVWEEFSVSEFISITKKAIKNIVAKGKVPILVGGTGLYIDSLINGLEFSEVGSNKLIRSYYENLSQTFCNLYMYWLLKGLDEEYASSIHYNNKVKVIRALEVIKSSNMTMTKYRKISALKPKNYNPFFIGLNYSDRQLLYNKINARVDIMVKKGLLEEAHNLFKRDLKSKTITNTIGYKELCDYFNGNESLEICLENIKMNSRRYAKRQLTWFRKNDDINWFLIDNYSSLNIIYEKALNKCISFLCKDY